MKKINLIACQTALLMTIAMSGCGGNSGPQQDRFNVERTPEEATGQTIRALVQDIENAGSGEGGDAIRGTAQSAMESMEAVEASNLSSEDQATFEKIKALTKEVYESEGDSQEKIAELVKLADQLPGQKPGGGGE